MSYDRAQFERPTRTGDALPDELIDIFKKNAAQRRSERADARRQKLLQHVQDVGKAKGSSPWTHEPQRSRRGRPGRRSPNPVPAGGAWPSLACDQGWASIGDRSAPFTWGSQEQPAYNSSADGTHLSSAMTRHQTGEFSLALVAKSDPTSVYAEGMNEGLGFKGEDISATIGQVYFVAGQGPAVVQAQAQLAMNSILWHSAMLWQGDAFAEAGGFATITVSEFAIDVTFPQGAKSRLLGQNSQETDFFGWLADPGGGVFSHAFTGDAYLNPEPLDLSVTLEHNNDAMYAMVEVDVEIFGYTQKGAANSYEPSMVYLDFRVTDDDDLVLGLESDATDIYPGGQYLPYPSPIILTETRLCAFYPKPSH